MWAAPFLLISGSFQDTQLSAWRAGTGPRWENPAGCLRSISPFDTQVQSGLILFLPLFPKDANQKASSTITYTLFTFLLSLLRIFIYLGQKPCSYFFCILLRFQPRPGLKGKARKKKRISPKLWLGFQRCFLHHTKWRPPAEPNWDGSGIQVSLSCLVS